MRLEDGKYRFHMGCGEALSSRWHRLMQNDVLTDEHPKPRASKRRRPRTTRKGGSAK